MKELWEGADASRMLSSPPTVFFLLVRGHPLATEPLAESERRLALGSTVTESHAESERMLRWVRWMEEDESSAGPASAARVPLPDPLAIEPDAESNVPSGMSRSKPIIAPLARSECVFEHADATTAMRSNGLD